MNLHPQVKALLERKEAEGTRPLYTLTLEEARKADLEAIKSCAGTSERVHRVENTTIKGPDGPLPLRIYTPNVAGPLPILLYLFGGGWSLGTIDTADAICRNLTNAVRCVVAVIGYRLAPEHKFPAAVEDCYAAAMWLADNATAIGGDAARIAIGGDSAGGNLAAAVTLVSRARGRPNFAFQLLVYPITDYFPDTPSMREVVDPLIFNRDSVAWYWGHYLRSQDDGCNPLAAPLKAPDLAGAPAALVITAEHDPLRDEAEMYAARLKAAGVPVRLSRYNGMIHGFFAMAGQLDDARRALDQASTALRFAFQSPSSRETPGV